MFLEYQNQKKEVHLVSKITPKLKVEFVKKYSELQFDEVDEAKLKALQNFDPTDENGIKNIKPLVEFSILQKRIGNPETIAHNDKVIVELFKMIVDRSGWDNQWNEWFNQDFEDDFWQNQDIVLITEQVQLFRSKTGI
jgi:hypothetical protein